ncbi:c-type cytochrome [Azohydromonas lata]|uniref:Cytochrome c n=1 Tax=Azohydromonas lata TaxID=45677 RepID=A0ABU5IE02_9BURK|nr:cytochrome c [Azohydromonas lata]MDZ5457347.1 cytochrome c [Azohydromonas lata]
MRRAWPLLLCSLPLLAGCERLMRNMYDQPRLDPGEPSSLFADGKASRPPPPGSVAHAMGDLAATSSGRRGDEVPAQLQAAQSATALPPVTAELLRRGQERYTIYCLPCHSPLGDGDGPIVRRGFPAPPSYHQQRLRQAPDRHFYDVITNGYGVMVPYADRVAPDDRWAIVAYIRALQLSQHAPIAALPPALQASLRALPPPGAASSAANGSTGR